MENYKNYDVIVLGGGFTGCAAAIAAARQGVKVLLRRIQRGKQRGEQRHQQQRRQDNASNEERKSLMAEPFETHQETPPAILRTERTSQP